MEEDSLIPGKDSLLPFVPFANNTALFFLTFLSSAGPKAVSPRHRRRRPISFTLPTRLHSVHLSLPASLGPPFLLLLLRPSLSVCLPPPLLSSLSPPPTTPTTSHPGDINRKGRLCSPREIYCFFKPLSCFPRFLSMGLSTRPPLPQKIRVAIGHRLSVNVRARACACVSKHAASEALLNRLRDKITPLSLIHEGTEGKTEELLEA